MVAARHIILYYYYYYRIPTIKALVCWLIRLDAKVATCKMTYANIPSPNWFGIFWVISFPFSLFLFLPIHGRTSLSLSPFLLIHWRLRWVPRWPKLLDVKARIKGIDRQLRFVWDPLFCWNWKLFIESIVNKGKN